MKEYKVSPPRNVLPNTEGLKQRFRLAHGISLSRSENGKTEKRTHFRDRPNQCNALLNRHLQNNHPKNNSKKRTHFHPPAVFSPGCHTISILFNQVPRPISPETESNSGKKNIQNRAQKKTDIKDKVTAIESELLEKLEES